MDSTVHFVVQRRGSVGTSDAERDTRATRTTPTRRGPAARADRQPRTRLHRRGALAPARAAGCTSSTVNPDTGETRFAADAAGHRANEKLFNTWCAAHKARC